MHVTGKWFNYGVIFIVMILDMNMWKNQIFYDPFTFGQYTDSRGYIYTVSNETFVRQANKTTLSHDWRWRNIDPATNRSYGESDFRMNSKYLGYSLGVKSLAFVPTIVAFIVFGLLVWFYGREKAVSVVAELSAVDGVVVDQWEEETTRNEEKQGEEGLTLIQEGLTLIKEGLTLIKERLTLIQEGLTLIKEGLTLIKEGLTLIKEGLTLIKEGLTLIKEGLTLIKEGLTLY